MNSPVALTIAGSDSSGGAGLQADLKTFAAFGVYGATVVTALTAQSTCAVRGILDVSPAFVTQQLDTVRDDLEIAAAKTGMLARAGVIDAVVEHLARRPLSRLVVDPVMVATSGDLLLEPDAVDALRARLLPLAALVTPNLREAEVLLDRPVRSVAGMRDAARALVDLGARAALVKGGHLGGVGGLAAEAVDVLYDGRRHRELRARRVPAGETHGGGCTLSAAVTAGLAAGRDLETAVDAAKEYVTRAIETATAIGHGARPVNHLFRPPR
jgi:hydroxymethylpyrimidine/phosphomethylpyrimidine kinase